MIITCVQKGSYVYVYGQGNRQLFMENGILVGYTGNSVSIKKQSYVYTYDANHRLISQHYSG